MRHSFVDDQHCYVCGSKNPAGLRLAFRLVKDHLETEFTPSKTFQGFKDVVHGGVIGLILDEMVVNLPYRLGEVTVTADFKMRLKHPHPVGQPLYFKGWIRGRRKNLLDVSAEARDRTGRLIATAQAVCVKIAETEDSP